MKTIFIYTMKNAPKTFYIQKTFCIVFNPSYCSA